MALGRSVCMHEAFQNDIDLSSRPRIPNFTQRPLAISPRHNQTVALE
jgi:hypothetical protein